MGCNIPREQKEEKRIVAERQKKDDNSGGDKSAEEMELSFAQLENACYGCGKKGHTSNKCYKKDTIPKNNGISIDCRSKRQPRFNSICK